MGTHESVPIFGLGNQSRTPFLSTVDRTNCVVELTDNGRQQQAIVGLPGLVEQYSFGTQPARCVFVKEGGLAFFVATGNTVLLLSPNSTTKTVATFQTDSGPVWMDDNGTQLMMNDGTSAFIYTYATGTTTAITSSSFPVGARGCVFLQGRFFVYLTTGPNAGRVYASAQYDGLTWNGLDFITPSARPTGIVSIARWFDDLIIMGQKSVEWWSGTPTAIPGALGFQPSANANTAVGASAELGYAKVAQRFFFIGHDDGTLGVYEIKGYSIEKVSIPAVDDNLSQLITSNAVCTGYMVTDHPIWQVTIKGQEKAKSATWIFDCSTNLWSKRSSLHKPCYRGLLASSTLNSVYISDAFTGKIYKMSNTVYDEAGDFMEYEVMSAHVLQDGDRLIIHKIQIDMEMGDGDDPSLNPRGLLAVSKDGGHTWILERFIELGKVGEYVRRAQEFQFGSARDFAVRLRITDAVPRRVSGAYLIAEPCYV